MFKLYHKILLPVTITFGCDDCGDSFIAHFNNIPDLDLEADTFEGAVDAIAEAVNKLPKCQFYLLGDVLISKNGEKWNACFSLTEEQGVGDTPYAAMNELECYQSVHHSNAFQ